MDISVILNERMNLNRNLISMSFPDIVSYLEKRPEIFNIVDWNLFTDPSIRSIKNIDNYPELILKHKNWPWKFDYNQIQNELNLKISQLNRLVNSKSSVSTKKENWIDKIINSMEKLCEIQNKINFQDIQIITNEIKNEVREEGKVIKSDLLQREIINQIYNEEMPPDDIGDITIERFLHESEDESDDFEAEDSSDDISLF